MHESRTPCESTQAAVIGYNASINACKKCCKADVASYNANISASINACVKGCKADVVSYTSMSACEKDCEMAAVT